MARNYVRTVTDMERYYYGAGNAMGYTYSGSELLKADSPMLSSTAGTYQAIYGRKVWSQLNQEFNAFSILPKRPWDRSGWRVITEKPNAGVVHGGLPENGVLPDTVKPTFQHVAAKPKTIAHSFDVSEVAVFLADKDDGLGDMRAVLKEEMGKHHAEMVNKMLLLTPTQSQETTSSPLTESLETTVVPPVELLPWKLVQQPQTTVVQVTLISTALTEVQTHGPTLSSTVALTKIQPTAELSPSTNWTMCFRECGNLVETLRLC